MFYLNRTWTKENLSRQTGDLFMECCLYSIHRFTFKLPNWPKLFSTLAFWYEHTDWSNFNSFTYFKLSPAAVRAHISWYGYRKFMTSAFLSENLKKCRLVDWQLSCLHTKILETSGGLTKHGLLWWGSLDINNGPRSFPDICQVTVVALLLL